MLCCSFSRPGRSPHELPSSFPSGVYFVAALEYLGFQIATACGACYETDCAVGLVMMNVVAARSFALKEEEIENIKSECIKLNSKKGKVKRSGLLVLLLFFIFWHFLFGLRSCTQPEGTSSSFQLNNNLCKLEFFVHLSLSELFLDRLLC